MTAVEHYPTGPQMCACGEQSNNTWAMDAHLRPHRKRDMSATTDLFASDVDLPTSMLLPSSATLSFDRYGRHKLYAPNSRYLRDLAKVAAELADAWDARDAAAGGAA